MGHEATVYNPTGSLLEKYEKNFFEVTWKFSKYRGYSSLMLIWFLKNGTNTNAAPPLVLL